MKNILIIFVFLLSFLSASFAELSCFCIEDSTTHSVIDSHEDSSSESKDHTDHCQHTCSQCHFVALVPADLTFESDRIEFRSSFLSLSESPRHFIQSLYRPPIS